MKRNLIVLFLLITYTACTEVTNEKNFPEDFKEYLDQFPVRDVPFKVLWDEELSSPVDIPLPKVSERFHEKYINLKGLESELDLCPEEYLYGFWALARFNISNNYELVIISIDSEPGCGEREMLISYNSQGEYRDHLRIFGRGFTKRPTEEDKSRIILRHEGIVGADNIEVIELKIEYSDKNERSEEKVSRSYKLDEDGKFQLISEE